MLATRQTAHVTGYTTHDGELRSSNRQTIRTKHATEMRAIYNAKYRRTEQKSTWIE